MARKAKNLPERKIIHVYTEGITEKKYFTKFKSTNEARKKINVEVKAFTGEKQGLPLMNYVDGKFSHTKKSEKPDEIYIIFDKDELSNEEVATCIKAFPNYQIGLSNRSFELWLVLHFQKVTSYKNQKELEDLLTTALGEKYVKANEEQLEIIIKEIATAHKNAIDFGELKLENFKKNPYTNLSQVIRRMLGED